MYIRNTIHHHLSPFVFFMQPNREARRNTSRHVNITASCTNRATLGRNNRPTQPLTRHVLLLLLLLLWHDEGRAAKLLQPYLASSSRRWSSLAARLADHLLQSHSDVTAMLTWRLHREPAGLVSCFCFSSCWHHHRLQLRAPITMVCFSANE